MTSSSDFGLRSVTPSLEFALIQKLSFGIEFKSQLLTVLKEYAMTYSHVNLGICLYLKVLSIIKNRRFICSKLVVLLRKEKTKGGNCEIFVYIPK